MAYYPLNLPAKQTLQQATTVHENDVQIGLALAFSLD